MSPHDDLHTLLDRVPVNAAPIGEVISAGRAARNTKRRIIAGLATGAAVVGAIAAVPVLTGDRSGQPDNIVASDPTDTHVPSDVGEKVLVGVGGAAVEVPAEWRNLPSECAAGAWDDNGVYYPWPKDCTPSEAAGTSSVTFLSALPDGLDINWREVGELDGHEIVEWGGGCTRSLPSTGCDTNIGIPDLDAYFTIRGAGDDGATLIEQIRDTLQVLPDGYVAVPWPENPEQRGSLAATKRALEAAGFTVTVDVNEYECPATALCVGNFITGITPDPGTVVRAGTTVTINYDKMMGLTGDPLAP